MRDVSQLVSASNSCYIMMGSSAAALTGLMFVVITLVSDDRRRASEDGISTFSTPTVFHFCCALFTSALMSAPVRSLVPFAVIFGLVGAGGMSYVAHIGHRTSKLQTYRPDVEDWAWNVLLPFSAYAALAGGAIAMPANAALALYAPAAAVVLLIFVGIHNAWDVVTFLATGKAEALPDRPPNGDAADKSD
ncbi:MAG: hypothetical protein NVSMB64_21960 [Candidatus Velthaea sp.]